MMDEAPLRDNKLMKEFTYVLDQVYLFVSEEYWAKK